MWGKIIGGMAGFAMGGPMGAVAGAALGHAVENGAGLGLPGTGGGPGFAGFGLPPAMPRLPPQRDQAFAIGVVVLAARLAKCDKPVVRAEIDAFKRSFRVPAGSEREVGRLFDRARDATDDYTPYAQQLGQSFADNRGMLEDVLAALFGIARADGPVNRAEEQFLQVVCRAFGLGSDAWGRARDNVGRSQPEQEDPYGVLGVARTTGDDELHAAWRQLMRDNHPDSLASRGVPPEFIARASDKVAKINAAWDRIKRERGL